AYALYPSPKLLVNAAAAERELGDLPGAATDLRHFLDDATEDDSSLVDKARSDLRAIEKKCGRVGLSGWPHGTTLEIDGRAARDPTYVRPGVHGVKVRAPNGVELEKEGDVSAVETAPPPHREVKKKRAGWIIPVAVLGALAVAGGVTVGVLYGTRSSGGSPLTGSLGTVKFNGNGFE